MKALINGSSTSTYTIVREVFEKIFGTETLEKELPFKYSPHALSSIGLKITTLTANDEEDISLRTQQLLIDIICQNLRTLHTLQQSPEEKPYFPEYNSLTLQETYTNLEHFIKSACFLLVTTHKLTLRQIISKTTQALHTPPLTDATINQTFENTT